MEYPSASTTHYQFPFPKKAFSLGVTPHGVGRCPEGTEGTAQYEGDRQQAVVGFPQHILKKRFTNSPKYDILYKNLSSQAYTNVFSANFAAYCVKNTCRATKKHRSQERIHQEAIF